MVIETASDALKVPIAISRWTGIRQGDVLKMAQTAYDGNTIRLRTSKQEVQVSIPVAEPLKEVLEGMKRTME